MIGDFILWIRLGWKQMFCKHTYKVKELFICPPKHTYECTKCGRWNSNAILLKKEH